MDKRVLHSYGPTWRQLYLAMGVALAIGMATLFVELRHGVGLGENLVAADKRGAAIMDSMAKSTELSRRAAELAVVAIARQDSIQHAIQDGVTVITRKLERLSAKNRTFQRAQTREVTRSVRHVEAKVDTVQAVVDSVQTSVDTLKTAIPQVIPKPAPAAPRRR